MRLRVGQSSVKPPITIRSLLSRREMGEREWRTKEGPFFASPPLLIYYFAVLPAHVSFDISGYGVR